MNKITSESDEVEVPETPVETPIYIVYPRRFYVLFVFSFLSFNQCMMWLTFSPIERNAILYYNITESTVDLLLNWGPIIFIPCLPLTSLLLNTANGLRYGVLILAIADFIAALIRILPSIILQATAKNFDAIALPFIHAGQILNAACGPLVMAPVSQISSVWFAPHERTRATTIAVLSNNLGSAVGFLISPYIVDQPNHVPYLLYLHFGLAFAACVCTLISFPARPPSPPSAAAELLATNAIGTEHEHSRRTFLRDIKACFTNPSFVFLSTAGGMIYGMFGAWTSLYDFLLEAVGYDEIYAGWCGFISTIAGVVGGAVFGLLGDLRRFQHSIKLLVVFALTACTLSIVWFELYVPSIFYDKGVLHSTKVTMAFAIALAGLFSGAAQPLIYEALAEITYPLHESLSASILVQWINVGSLVLLFIAPGREKLIDFLVLVVIVISLLLVFITRFTYGRRDEDERKRIEKEQNLRHENENINQPVDDIDDRRQYGTFSRTHLVGDYEDDLSTPGDERI